MTREIPSLRETPEPQQHPPLKDASETREFQRRAAMKEAIAAYVQGNPSQEIFALFLPSTQDLDLITQAAAQTSMETGKAIQVLYPSGISQTIQEEP